MIVFKNFSFRNAVVYDSFEADLSSSGVVLIVGENRNTGGSNGAGKSLPWSILRNILFGSTERGSRKDDLVKGKNYECHLSFSKDGDDYDLHQYRSHRIHKNKYVIVKNGKDITPRGIVDSEKLIREIIGMSEDEFSSSVHLTGNSVHVLISGSRSDRLNYLSSIFDLSAYDEVRSVIKEDLDIIKGKIAVLSDKTSLYDQLSSDRKKINLPSLKKELSKLEVKLSKLRYKEHMLNRQYVKAQRLEELRKKVFSKEVESVEKLESEVISVRSNLDSISEEMSVLESKVKNNERYRELEDLIKEKEKERDRLSEELRKKYPNVRGSYYETRYHFWRYCYNYLSKQVMNLEKRCPVCGHLMNNHLFTTTMVYSKKQFSSFLDRKLKAEKQREEKKKIEDLDNEIKRLGFKLLHIDFDGDADLKYEELKRKRNKLTNKLYNLTDKLSEAKIRDEVNNEINSLLEEIGELSPSDILSELEKVKGEVSEVQSRVHYLKTEINKAESLDEKLKEMESMIEDLKALKRRESLFSFLYRIYSPNGLKLERLKSIVNDLSSNINYYSSFLFSDLKFNLSCDSHGIDFIASNGDGKGFDVQFMSGGEKKRLTISLLLSSREMMSPSKRTNLLILDEIDSNMDSIGKDYISRFLIPELRKSISSVFVITHSHDLLDRSVYDQVWTVIREGDNSYMIKE